MITNFNKFNESQEALDFLSNLPKQIAEVIEGLKKSILEIYDKKKRPEKKVGNFRLINFSDLETWGSVNDTIKKDVELLALAISEKTEPSNIPAKLKSIAENGYVDISKPEWTSSGRTTRRFHLHKDVIDGLKEFLQSN